MQQKTIIILLLVGIIGLSWIIQERFNKKNGSSESNQLTGKISKLDPANYDQLAQQDQVFVVDVHTPEQEHLPMTDAVIPYNQLRSKKAKLPEDKSQSIIVYCRSGGMSAGATQTLVEMGYKNVYDLEGGANAYRANATNDEAVKVLAAPTEQLTISPETQDLGKVVYGEVANTSFTLTNLSGEELEVTRLSTSCGCTKAEIADPVIKSGDTGEIKVSFDPAVHGDDTDIGEITRTIYIETNNPQQEKLERTITATVVKN